MPSRLVNGVREDGIPEWHPLPERRLRCYKCGYEWDTQSKLMYVTCPSCHYKIDSTKSTVAKVPQGER